jgi:hypothetical protein
MATVTQALNTELVPTVAEYAEIIQIGSRNMQNFALLPRAGRRGIPVRLTSWSIRYRASEPLSSESRCGSRRASRQSAGTVGGIADPAARRNEIMNSAPPGARLQELT